MDTDGGGSCLLANLGHFHAVDAVFVPALADFYGDRHLYCPAHGLHNAAAQVGVFHQGAAAAVIGDLGGGASHIDVDSVRGKGHGLLGGQGHHLRLIAKNLNGRRVLVFIQPH